MISMDASAFFWHLLNFLAPAAFLAVALGLGAWVLRIPRRLPLWTGIGLNFVLGSIVLGAGLALTGSDGKLTTYGALVLVMGSFQWLLRRNTGAA
ncbi:Uncharacterised protein [uncultured Comamonas sp.]|nr:Uncharacterised protein [uncultured Comamonas sp.]